MAKPIKVWKVKDEDDFFSIVVYRKYADGMESGLNTMFVVGSVLLLGILLSFIFLSFDAAIGITILICVFSVPLVIAILRNLSLRGQVEEIHIDKDRIYIIKTTKKTKYETVILKQDLKSVRLDDPDKMDSGLEMILFFISPMILIVLGLTQRSSAVTFFTNRGTIRFFDFGSNAQKAWATKAMTNFLQRNSYFTGT